MIIAGGCPANFKQHIIVWAPADPLTLRLFDLLANLYEANVSINCWVVADGCIIMFKNPAYKCFLRLFGTSS